MAILDEKQVYEENRVVPEEESSQPAHERVRLLAHDIIIYADDMAWACREGDRTKFEDARAGLLRNAVDIGKLMRS